jgi:hypothetical protein
MTQIDADLLVVGGDQTRDGDTHEYEYQLARGELESLPFPAFVIPGNMDVGNKHTSVNGPDRNDIHITMTSARLQLFASHFGPINWTFLHKEVRFTGFYAAVAGSGLPEEERFWQFVERLPSLPPGRHHVATMHYWLYMDSIDEPNWGITKEDEYLFWYFGLDEPHRSRLFEALKKAKVKIMFCGHVHTGRPVEVVDGVRIYKTSAGGNTAQLTDRRGEIETRQGFHRCDVTETGVDVAFVPGDVQIEDYDVYGSAGHPTLEERDYANAPEQPPLAPDPWLLSS